MLGIPACELYYVSVQLIHLFKNKNFLKFEFRIQTYFAKYCLNL